MSWMDNICTYCLHHDDDHELGPSQRTPRALQYGLYMCMDCITCEVQMVGGTD